jgi:hypothetical protein
MHNNKIEIEKVLEAVRNDSPLPDVTKTTWEYPGYIHIQFPSHPNPDFYIALGRNLSTDIGYTWNDVDGIITGEIDDLDSAQEIAAEFWRQVIEELSLT